MHRRTLNPGLKPPIRWPTSGHFAPGSSRDCRGFVRLWQFRSLPKPAERDARGTGLFWREPAMARVEAALFLAREPLTSRKIAQLASLADGTEARTLVRRLNRLYDAGRSAFRVEEVAGGYQLLTRPMFGPWLRRLLSTSVETRLSAPALETLAVVAYRQPILRAEIEAVRGVQCGDILRQLMERDLVRIAGRSDDLGRPLMYGTTKRFLELFGLKNLDELPRAAELRYGSGLSNHSSDVNNNATTDNHPGAGRVEDNLSHDPIPEEESVTTRIRPAHVREEFVEETSAALLEASRRNPTKPVSAAIDDDDLDDEEDEDWDEEEDEDEDDDFVDEDWEEVDDEDEEDEEDEDWDDDEDEDWDDEDEDVEDDEE